MSTTTNMQSLLIAQDTQHKLGLPSRTSNANITVNIGTNVMEGGKILRLEFLYKVSIKVKCYSLVFGFGINVLNRVSKTGILS